MKEVKSEREKPRAVAVEASSTGIICSLVVLKREMERERERESKPERETKTPKGFRHFRRKASILYGDKREQARERDESEREGESRQERERGGRNF
jgi:hypothetical protein